MPSSPPLFPVIAAVVSHTPAWVWGVLVLLIVLGSLQLRAQRLPRLRVVMLPLGMGAYSAWVAVSLFGLHTGVVLAWSTAMLLAATLTRSFDWSPGVRHEPATDCFDVPGSGWPLALMLTVFAVRYGVAVTLVFHRDWAADMSFAMLASALYGGLSGLLAARGLSILRQAQPAPRTAPSLA